jgi:hypothetical protein
MEIDRFFNEKENRMEVHCKNKGKEMKDSDISTF